MRSRHACDRRVVVDLDAELAVKEQIAAEREVGDGRPRADDEVAVLELPVEHVERAPRPLVEELGHRRLTGFRD